jgi:hypothetical protein
MSEAPEYEQWIAYPNRVTYVHREDNWAYASTQGWWSTGRFVSKAYLESLNLTPEARRKTDKIPAPALAPTEI